MTLAVCVANDLRLQFRHGLYTVYGVLCFLYIFILRALPPAGRQLLLPVLVFIDPSMLGFFFVGGIVLLEKADRTLSSLFTTPLGLGHYFLAKIISLALLGLLASLFIAVAGAGLAFRPLLLAAGVLLTSAVFTLIGLTAVSYFPTVNDYLISSALYMLPFVVPLFEYFGIFSSPLLYLLPSKGSLVLIAGAFSPEPLTPGEWIPATVSLIVWTAGAWLWAKVWFHRYIILRIGAQS